MNKEIELFSIPIYALTKNNFEQKWQKRDKECFDFWIKAGKTKQKAINLTLENGYPFRIWKYNQIIGWFNVSIKETNDIFIEVFLTTTKQIRIDSTRRNFCVERTSNNMHFDTTGMSNKDISETILKIINNFKDNNLSKNRFVDLTNYYNVFQFIDYNTIINNFKDWPLIKNTSVS